MAARSDARFTVMQFINKSGRNNSSRHSDDYAMPLGHLLIGQKLDQVPRKTI
jgi:hypothetical protein